MFPAMPVIQWDSANGQWNASKLSFVRTLTMIVTMSTAAARIFSQMYGSFRNVKLYMHNHQNPLESTL
jgi:hypothetical protein